MGKYTKIPKQTVIGDRFCPMTELQVRLGRSRGDIYKQYREDPNFPELVKSGGRTGALDSNVQRYLESLPKLTTTTREDAR